MPASEMARISRMPEAWAMLAMGYEVDLIIDDLHSKAVLHPVKFKVE